MVGEARIDICKTVRHGQTPRAKRDRTSVKRKGRNRHMDGTGFAGRIAAIGKRCAAALARRTEAESDVQRGEDVAEAKEKATAAEENAEVGRDAKDVERTAEAEKVRNCTEKALNGTETEKKDVKKVRDETEKERKDVKKAMTGNESEEKDTEKAHGAVEEEDGRKGSDGTDEDDFFEDGEDESEAEDADEDKNDGENVTDGGSAQGERENDGALAAETARENERRLSEIKRVFPQCGAASVEELGDAFAKLMAAGAQIGLSAADAYAATHISQIRAEADRAAESRARARAGSKAHLVRSEGSQSTLCEVPKGVYEKYKRLMPNVSDREIREHYNRSLRDEAER